MRNLAGGFVAAKSTRAASLCSALDPHGTRIRLVCSFISHCDGYSLFVLAQLCVGIAVDARVSSASSARQYAVVVFTPIATANSVSLES